MTTGPAITLKKMDLIFVIDTTGSMSDDIANVKAQATDIVNALDSKAVNYRVAVADYRDYPQMPYGGSGDYVYKLDCPFSNDQTAINNAINGLAIGDGEDAPEAVNSALINAMTDVNKDPANELRYGWRSGITKAIIQIGDAPGHDPEPFPGGYSSADVASWSKKIDPVGVYTICIGSDPSAISYFSSISSSTGGVAFTTTDASTLVDTIIQAIGEIPTEPPIMPVANFTENKTSGYAPLAVGFKSTSTNSTDLQWNFGDLTANETSATPLHVFTTAGTFNVVLTANNSNGTSSYSQLITVTNKPVKPGANFVANVTSGFAPLTVGFTDTSTNSPTNWTWDFGDGKVWRSTIISPTAMNVNGIIVNCPTQKVTTQNATHVYTNPGKYTVKLTVSNSAGTSIATKTNYITVSQLKPPVAKFSVTPEAGRTPLHVTFKDTSAGSNLVSWNWTFGNGNTSLVQNPTIQTYSKRGVYTVRLTVKNSAGATSTAIRNVNAY
jgi:PKD repeat protein